MFPVFILWLSLVCAAPTNNISNDNIISTSGKNNTQDETNATNGNIEEYNSTDTQSRAGIIDNLNPFINNEKPSQSAGEQNNQKDGTTQSSNFLEPIQNLFANRPQILGGSNPLEQLMGSQSGGNFLDNIKVFLIGTQGMVMPASSILGGFQNLMQMLGNMGNLMQLPSLPSNT